MSWLRRRAPLLAWLMLVAMGSFGFYLIALQRHDACVARNESIVGAATVVIESLIEYGGEEVTPEEVERINQIVERRLEKVLTDC